MHQFKVERVTPAVQMKSAGLKTTISLQQTQIEVSSLCGSYRCLPTNQSKGETDSNTIREGE